MGASKMGGKVFALDVETDAGRTRYVLHPGVNRVGRDRANEIVIDEEGVSRHHANLVVEGETVTVLDAGSTNGTFVSGLKIAEGPVGAGASLCFGSVVAFLVQVDPEDAVAGVPVASGTKVQTGLGESGATTGISTLDRGEVVPANWLRAVRYALSVPVAGDANSGEVLHVIRATIGARAVVSIDLRAEDEISVRGVSGEVPAADLIEESAAELREALESAGHPSGWKVLSGANHTARVASWREDDGRISALIAFGVPSFHNGAATLLEECLHAVGTAMSSQQPPANPRGTIRGALVFPEDYVPCESASMRALYGELERLIPGDLPILITGETGVGKEAIARSIHLSSSRKEGPFVAVNCAAIPSELLEAELFGIGGRVATGVGARPGKMAVATGGILFLDEIGEMPRELQAKLLRALEEGEVCPVGGSSPIEVDLRIVSATNADVDSFPETGALRVDLFYRLAGAILRVPPLRERPGDIPLLVQRVVEDASMKLGRRVEGVSLRVLRALMAAEWPGNVRELQHEVQRMVHLCPEGQLITSVLLPPRFQAIAPDHRDPSRDQRSGLEIDPRLRDLERDLIVQALSRTGGNRTQAAKLLGISRYGLSLKLKRLGLERWLAVGIPPDGNG